MKSIHDPRMDADAAGFGRSAVRQGRFTGAARAGLGVGGSPAHGGPLAPLPALAGLGGTHP
jgi:hypothetical protein